MGDFLIRGFKLPKYDSVTITIYPNGVVKRFNEKTYHPPEIFHATQLPPHGRCIDADAFQRTIRPINDDDAYKACTFETVKMILMEQISEAPTVIEAED